MQMTTNQLLIAQTVGKISTCDPILNFVVRIRVRFRVKARVGDGIVFRVKVWFYLSIQWKLTNGGAIIEYTIHGISAICIHTVQ